MSNPLFRITQHAINRYRNRIRPDLTDEQAYEALCAEIEALDGAVIAQARRDVDAHIHTGRCVLVVSFGSLITVLVPSKRFDTRQTQHKCEYCDFRGPYKPFLQHVMAVHLQQRQEAAE